MISCSQQPQHRFFIASLFFLLVFTLSGCNLDDDISSTPGSDSQNQDSNSNDPGTSDAGDDPGNDPQTQDDTAPPNTSNHQPTAKITAPQASTSGQTVTLDGSGSSDPDNDNLSYQWAQTKGPDIPLSNNSSSNFTFVAPSVAQATEFAFKLTVNDGALSNSATVSVQISPIADNTGPSIVFRSPEENQSGVSTTAEVSVGFDEALLEASVDSQSFSLSQNGSPVSGAVSYDSANNTITNKPASALSPDTTYTVTLAKTLEDHSGNNFSGDSWDFSTAAEAVTDGLCATAEDNNSLTLSCPDGQVIKQVTFASYGNPGGMCGSFTTGSCDASRSVSVVADACEGKNSCTLVAGSESFGDPCEGKVKKLAAQVACGMATDTTPDPNQNSDCPVELVGYATVDGDVTGGGDATPTIVTTLAELREAAQDSAPRVVVVSGTISTMADGDGYPLRIASNKTIMGADKNATIYGGLKVSGVSNVIIRNLNIHGVYPDSGPSDTLSSSNSHHIWWDHLAVWDADDGLLDITNQSDYQTVSWSKFYYTNSKNGHRLASLNGSGGGDHPEDWGHLRITYHHNWWGELVTSRMPRVVYGKGHQFNNYFNSKGNSYCIGVGSYGSVLVENNYFKDVNNPHQFMYDVYMYAAAEGNIYDNTSGARDTGKGGNRDACPGGDCSIQENFEPGPFDPPYEYTMHPAEDVPEIVQRCAGPQ